MRPRHARIERQGPLIRVLRVLEAPQLAVHGAELGVRDRARRIAPGRLAERYLGLRPLALARLDDAEVERRTGQRGRCLPERRELADRARAVALLGGDHRLLEAG